MKKLACVLLLIGYLLLSGCGPTIKKQGFLAFGDSYTAGKGPIKTASFPNQLAEMLHVAPENYFIVAQNGWTTAQLLDSIQALPSVDFPVDFVTLLIGVNDQYEGVSKGDYASNLNKIFDYFDSNWKEQPFYILSIPDYGVTPFGMKRPATTAMEIDALNAILRNEVAKRSERYTFINITDHYRAVGSRPENLAPDQLHPSADLYRYWVKQIIKELH